MTKTFKIALEGAPAASFFSITDAAQAAKLLLNNDTNVICIEDESGDVVASVRTPGLTIEGTFIQERYGDAHERTSEKVGEQTFDATFEVLNLPYVRFVYIQDNDNSSDDIGLRCVSWNGPYEVRLQDAIHEFFGMDREEVTPEHFEYVVKNYMPDAPVFKTFDITTRIKVRVNSGADVASLSSELDYNFTSGTDGVVIKSTEITGCVQVDGE